MKPWIYGAGVALVVLILGLALSKVGLRFDPFNSAGRAKAEAAASKEQAASATEATRQLDHYTNTVTVIREKQDAAVQSVQNAPGASESVPDGVLAGWRSAIDGMRDKPPAPVHDRP